MVFGRDQLSTECRTNLGRLPKGVRVSTRFDTLPDSGTVIVDALLGTGVRGEVTGLAVPMRSGSSTLPVAVGTADRCSFANGDRIWQSAGPFDRACRCDVYS
ncbi:MAG: hypothetical protein ACLR8Y_18800 [Alistipes indistinctus]